MTSDDLVRVEGVHKEYRGAAPWSARTRALRGISFTVRRGSILGLLGPNGAGKSTTLHLLLGFLAPSRGFVLVDGQPSDSPRSRKSLGFLAEVFAFDRFVSGRRLLERFDALSGNEPTTRARRVDEALNLVNLASESRRKIGGYSKGMTQRIGLAQALLGDPDLLILDEPMSGMDPANRRSVKDLLLQRKERGRTVLFSSHILTDVEEIADHVVILSGGLVVANAGLSELHERSRVVRIVFRTSDDSPDRDASRSLGRAPVPMGDAGVFALEVEGEQEIQRALEALTSARAQVLSVVPVRTDLETLFLSLTGDAARQIRS